MFFDLFKKKNKENAKIQELEQTIQKLTAEVESLKKSVSENEDKPEPVVEQKHDQVLPKVKDKVLLTDSNILSSKETYLYGKKTVVYDLNIGIVSDNIISIIQLFKKENAKMSSCHVSTFSDSGSCSNCTFWNLEDLKQLSDRDQFSSPYMTFYVDFLDTLTAEYQYSMECSTNDNRVFVYLDPAKKTKSE